MLSLCLAAGAADLLTMEEAVRRALETHPEMAAARASRAVAAFQLQASRAWPVPEFRLTTNNLGADPETAEIRNSVAWRWSPPRPRELSFKARIAEARRTTVEAEIRAAEAKVAGAVRYAYRRAALAAEREEVAARTVTLRAQMLEVVRRQVATGLKERVEVDLAELAREDADAQRQRASATAALEMRRLARLIDPAGTIPFALAKVELGTGTGDREKWTERAFQRRAELAQTAGDCEAAKAEAALARNGRYPWISFAQVTRRMGSGALERGPWGFQAGIDLPLFRTAAQAEQRVATASAAKCQLELAALRDRVRREVEEAAMQLDAGVAELLRLEALLQGPATRALVSLRAALEAGRADRLEVLQAEARQLSLQERWLERRMEVAALESQLEQATGL